MHLASFFFNLLVLRTALDTAPGLELSDIGPLSRMCCYKWNMVGLGQGGAVSSCIFFVNQLVDPASPPPHPLEKSSKHGPLPIVWGRNRFHGVTFEILCHYRVLKLQTLNPTGNSIP